MALPHKDFERLRLLLDQEMDWLLGRLFHYAQRQEFTRYSPPLKEAWRMSLLGLNRAILAAADHPGEWELHPDADYRSDAACRFGIVEAQRHRARGVNLAMFLGLFKYYRQTYQDLLKEKGGLQDPGGAATLVDRLFDRIEIAFCTEWAGTDAERQVGELASANRVLANQKNLFLNFFENLSSPAFLIDEDGMFIHMNPAGSHLLGRSAVPGAHYYLEDRRPEVPPFLQQEILDFLATGDDRLVLEFPCFLGEATVCFEAHLQRLEDVGGKQDGAALSLMDITQRNWARKRLESANLELERALAELRRTQDQLIQSEKMAAIGQLAAGIAHEINNPIGFISTNLGQLKEYSGQVFRMLQAYEEALPLIGDEARRRELLDLAQELEIPFLAADTPQLIEQTREGLDRVTGIVRDLKNFSRQSSDRWELADLNGLIDSTVNVVWNQIKDKAALHREFGDLPELECHPNQIAQVVMNLVVNAVHAIESRGNITIRTGREGDSAWFEVQDDGSGIPAGILDRIFDPFFTTKPVGKGTGLGLSVSHGIVDRHHGAIRVDSGPGAGSRFRVVLPLVQVRETDPADEPTVIGRSPAPMEAV
ncbi:MAG: ATP-binding protein [bacterium]